MTRAYHSEEHEQHLIDCEAEEFLMSKSTRNQPLSKEDERYNKRESKIRVRVEHVFARMKQMGMDYVRRIGLKRVTQHNHLSNLVYNMDRYAFLKR